MRPSTLFRKIRRSYPEEQADRIIALMLNGVNYEDAVRAVADAIERAKR